MSSLPKNASPAARRTATTVAQWAACLLCGVLAVGVTLVAMGRWPSTPQRNAPAVAAAAGASPQATNVPTRSAAPSPSPSAASPAQTHAAVDALARLEAARNRPLPPEAANASHTFDEALQHAFSYPSFDALAGRTDAEGLFEAAAWADACARSAVAAQESALRCSDARLRDPHYADTLLFKAATAGQPAAALTLAGRYPAQWMDVPLAGNDAGSDLDDTLGERIFTLAAHGSANALALLTQWCATPDACTDSRLTRNTLALLQLGFYQTGTSDPTQYLTGDENDRRAALDRADALRKLLKLPS